MQTWGILLVLLQRYLICGEKKMLLFTHSDIQYHIRENFGTEINEDLKHLIQSLRMRRCCATQSLVVSLMRFPSTRPHWPF